jgi:ribosome-associated protein
MIPVSPQVGIDEKELTLSFVRSGGPGGQNVNKVSTAVQLRFDVLRSPSLPEGVRRRCMALAGGRLTADGVIVLHASRFRTQEQNRRDAIDRLVELVRRALVVPKRRKKTRPTFASKHKRFEAKKLHGQKKRSRRFGRADIE